MAASIYRHFVLCVVAMCVWALCESSVINDVNNMLRDNVAAKVNNVKGVMLRNDEAAAATSTATATNVGYAEKKSDDDNGDGGEESSVELLRFVNDNDGNSVDATTMNNDAIRTTTHQQQDALATDSLSMSDQVRLLAKQMNALMTRRREDYELLERNLRNTLAASVAAATTGSHSTDAAASSSSLRNELEALRREVKFLQNGHFNDNKERLTIEWLQQSVSELRKQIAELQQIAGDAVRDINRGSHTYEDLETIRNDYQQLKLEVVALRERQQQNDVYVRELREELMQQEDQMQHEQNKIDGKQQQQQSPSNQQGNTDPDLLADHKRRHCRFQQEQIHHLQVAQRSLKRQLNELKYHRISDRVRSIEIEQHRIADANFNLSRQIASLDKLHASMFELLEDVEGLQTRMDKTVPDLRHELSKLEFVNAQLTSEQNMLREEGKNVARSLQAMAVSVSTLQDERTGIKQTQANVSQLRSNVDRLQSMMDDVQRALVHRRGSDEKKHPHHHRRSHVGEPTKQNQPNQEEPTAEATATQPSNAAELLVAKLENVEEQYESIVRNLPEDCATAVSSTKPHDGIYMIAPAGQSRPQMAHCSADGWTTVQRRYDGSANFNRSWEDYAAGFGSPGGEYWIGNEQLHHLTRNNCTSLRVIMQDIYDNVWVAEYAHFYISSRADGYRLDVGGYGGNASNALDYQQGMQFSAIDVDRDISQTHCAANYEGGWWFSHCQHANLNGRYNLGLTWFDAARNEWIAVKSSEMLLKRQVCPYAAAVDSATSKATDESRAGPESVTTATMASTSTTRQATPTAAAT